MKSGQLKRHSYPKGGKPLRKKSKKLAALAPGDTDARLRALDRAGHRCELPGEFGLPCCESLEVHHLIGRGTHSVRQQDENQLVLCTTHHDFATKNKRVFNALIGRKYPGRLEQLQAIVADFKRCNPPQGRTRNGESPDS